MSQTTELSSVQQLFSNVATIADREQSNIITPNKPKVTLEEPVDTAKKINSPTATIDSIAEAIRLREAPNAKEGETHRGQEGKLTSRMGILLDDYPKNSNETDLQHFSRVYTTAFQPTIKNIMKKNTKMKEEELAPMIWNTGTSSTIAKGLMKYNIETDTKKLFGIINGTVGTDENTKWSPGLVNARVKDWNTLAGKYAKDKVIKTVKYWKQDGKTYRTYTMADGTTRTLYVTKPLAKGSKDPAGTTETY